MEDQLFMYLQNDDYKFTGYYFLGLVGAGEPRGEDHVLCCAGPQRLPDCVEKVE